MAAKSRPPVDKREYIRVSVDFPNHPKLMVMPEEIIPLAGWLAATAWCYCGENKTDGEFPPNLIYRTSFVGKEIGKELIAVGLWHEAGHDCPKCPQPKERMLISHDYLEHQRSREEVETLRAARSGAGAKGAEKRWANRKPIASAMASATQGVKASAIAKAWQGDGKSDGNSIAEVEVEEEVVQELFPTPDGVGASKRKTLDDHWAEWWSVYPNKNGKGAARTAWDRARKAVSVEDLLVAVRRFAADPNLPKNRSKIPYPQKWLNEQRYEDGPLPADTDQGPAEITPDGKADPDVVLGKDRWQPPTPPEDIQPGTREYTEWLRQQYAARHAERQAEAEALIARRTA